MAGGPGAALATRTALVSDRNCFKGSGRRGGVTHFRSPLCCHGPQRWASGDGPMGCAAKGVAGNVSMVV